MDDSRTAQPEASIHVNHWCEHPGCDRWGGFGRSNSRNEPSKWWCSEHYPYWGEIRKNAGLKQIPEQK